MPFIFNEFLNKISKKINTISNNVIDIKEDIKFINGNSSRNPSFKIIKHYESKLQAKDDIIDEKNEIIDGLQLKLNEEKKHSRNISKQIKLHNANYELAGTKVFLYVHMK